MCTSERDFPSSRTTLRLMRESGVSAWPQDLFRRLTAGFGEQRTEIPNQIKGFSNDVGRTDRASRSYSNLLTVTVSAPEKYRNYMYLQLEIIIAENNVN
jgi:hypothetical protein